MTEYSVLTLNEKINNGGVQLVDVRESGEFAGGRVAAAKLIPLGEIANRATEIDREKPVYVICRTGRRSAEAQTKLKALGFAGAGNAVEEEGFGSGF